MSTYGACWEKSSLVVALIVIVALFGSLCFFTSGDRAH
ncbi:hypothetical protein HM1_2489 [Heliomicrobium modesticaldum Ice1]|uniref:Uncharacterized protein n=1 Tax=Heliobacterium modesticaldum (strain ATCC 51547 / Ice1) TaxID=498761 RepID=B0TAI8_HELMI|nr:hypothetical protein HM1_2489 [Heliomicrobium modesticaldum Ice1]